MTTPNNLPPLPPNTRYGGLVRDMKGDCRAFYHTKSEGNCWIGPVQLCPYHGPPGSSGDWHIALPIEAVREHAKERVPISTRPIPPRCEPASGEPTGVEAIATREWCVKSAEIEGDAEIGAGTPSGVCKASGVATWNPLDHGIQGVPLMVAAHDFNRVVSQLAEREAQLEVATTALEKIALGVDVSNVFAGSALARIDAKGGERE